MNNRKSLILLLFLALAGTVLWSCSGNGLTGTEKSCGRDVDASEVMSKADCYSSLKSFSRRYTFRGYDRYDVVDKVLPEDGRKLLNLVDWEIDNMRSSFSEMIKRLPSGWNDTVMVLCVSGVEETINLNFLIWNRTDSIHILDYPLDGSVESHFKTIWPMDMERMVKMDKKWLEHMSRLVLDCPKLTVFRIIQESDSVLYIEGRSFNWNSPHEAQSLRTPPGLLAE